MRRSAAATLPMLVAAPFPLTSPRSLSENTKAIRGGCPSGDVPPFMASQFEATCIESLAAWH